MRHGEAMAAMSAVLVGRVDPMVHTQDRRRQACSGQNGRCYGLHRKKGGHKTGCSESLGGDGTTCRKPHGDRIEGTSDGGRVRPLSGGIPGQMVHPDSLDSGVHRQFCGGQGLQFGLGSPENGEPRITGGVIHEIGGGGTQTSWGFRTSLEDKNEGQTVGGMRRRMSWESGISVRP